MTIDVRGRSGAKYTFEGPYNSAEQLKDDAGVYVIFDNRADGKFYPVDVGESEGVKSRVLTHDRKDCWPRHTQGTSMVAGFYTPGVQKSVRVEFEQDIRKNYTNLCGDR